jgi:hypothetical protein
MCVLRKAKMIEENDDEFFDSKLHSDIKVKYTKSLASSRSGTAYEQKDCKRKIYD